MSKQPYQTIVLSVVASLTSLFTVGIIDHHLYAAATTTDSTLTPRPTFTPTGYTINLVTSTNPSSTAPQFPGYPNYSAAANWSWTLPQCNFWTVDFTDMPGGCVNTYDGKKYKYHVRKMQALCPPGYVATGVRVDDMINQLNGVWPQCQQLQLCIGGICTAATNI